MKTPSEAHKVPELASDKRKRAASPHVLVCGSELVPKKRTSYALYLEDPYDSVKQQLGLREGRYRGKSFQLWRKLTKSESKCGRTNPTKR